MISLFIGGILLLLIGGAMVLFAAFSVSAVWGVSCLLPPVQWLFAAQNFGKAWDALLIQLLGLVMLAVFHFQAGGLGATEIAQAWVVFQRENGMATALPPTGTAVIGSQDPQAAMPVDTEVMQTVGGEAAPVTVTGAARVEVDDKPINKCIDPDGNEKIMRGDCPMNVKKTK